jgi:hypothetical protein
MKFESKKDGNITNVDNGVEEKLKNSPSYEKALDIINKINIKFIPENLSKKLQVLSRIFALGAILSAPSVNAEKPSENLETEKIVIEMSVDQYNLDNPNNLEVERDELESSTDTNEIDESGNEKNTEYFNKYDQELLSINPTDILKEQWDYRDNPTAETRFEFELNDGTPFEEAYKDLQEVQKDLEPIPLSDDNREVGDLKSVYDSTLQVQRIYSLVEEGKIGHPNNKIFIDRTFRSEDQISGAMKLSIQHLTLELSKIEDGKYQNQIDQINSSLKQLNDDDPNLNKEIEQLRAILDV